MIILDKKASSNHVRLNFQNHTKIYQLFFCKIPNLILVNTDKVWKFKILVLSKPLKIYFYVYNILKFLELKKHNF
jgi:hypothetical protein